MHGTRCCRYRRFRLSPEGVTAVALEPPLASVNDGVEATFLFSAAAADADVDAGLSVDMDSAGR